MTKLCECGCGEPAPIATQTSTRFGHVQGQPMRFILGHAGRKSQVEYVVAGNGCWVWQRWINKAGYGVRTVSHGCSMLAHRWYYEQAHGAIAEDRELHHVCHNRACVNPAHMECLTKAEHALRHRATACNLGHAFTPENTYTTSQGYRQCRICRRRRDKRLREAIAVAEERLRRVREAARG